MRRTHRSAPILPLALTIVALAAAGCGGYGSSGGSTAAGPAPAAAPAAVMTASGVRLPAGVSLQMVALGDSLFNTGGCQRCHGQKGVGAKNAPSLVEGPWLHSKGTYEEIITTVTNGVAKEEFKDSARPFAMRARGGPMNLSDDQVKAVAAYVYSISRGKK
jgi:mono/diheme cytochrome c family protein